MDRNKIKIASMHLALCAVLHKNITETAKTADKVCAGYCLDTWLSVCRERAPSGGWHRMISYDRWCSIALRSRVHIKASTFSKKASQVAKSTTCGRDSLTQRTVESWAATLHWRWPTLCTAWHSVGSRCTLGHCSTSYVSTHTVFSIKCTTHGVDVAYDSEWV